VRTYGQYCPVARTAELFAERWTPIIVRNLLGGAETFGELRDGAPGIPKALLSERLRRLEHAGVVERTRSDAGRVRYGLTESGMQLKAVCDAMGQWGMRWLEVEPQHRDPGYVAWATARLIDPDRLPPQPVTVRLELAECPTPYWLLCRRPQAEVCIRYPGTPEDLIISTDSDALALFNLRRVTVGRLLREGRLVMSGPTALTRAFPTWLRPSPYAARSA
jgi:DNA-binding HxlR family transcriptional regulator